MRLLSFKLSGRPLRMPVLLGGRGKGHGQSEQATSGRKAARPSRKARESAVPWEGRPTKSRASLVGALSAMRSVLGRRRGTRLQERPQAPAASSRLGQLPCGCQAPRTGLAALADRLREELHRLRHPRTVTFCVENGVIRTVIFEGDEVVAWGMSDPHEELVKLDSAIADGSQPAEGDPSEAEQPATANDMHSGTDWRPTRLRALFDEVHVHHGRLVTDLPIYTPMMRHMRLPRVARRYVQQVILSEVLDSIPFSAEEVDVTWQLRRTETGQEVVAVAVPKVAMDSHVQAVREARMRPVATYSKATALAFAAGLPDVIVLHLVPGRAAIVLVSDGVPRVVHEVELREHGADVMDQAEAIARAVEQVEGYFQTLESSEESPSMPVMLTGISSDGPLAEAVLQMVQREVRPFVSPVNHPRHFPPVEYALNIGLALAHRERARPRKTLPRKKAVSINLLPERYLPQPLPIKPVAVFVSILLFGSVAFNFTSQVNDMSAEAATLSSRLDQLERQARQHRLSLARASATQSDIEAASQLSLSLESYLDSLQKEIEDLLSRLDTITREALPPGVEIATVALQGNELSLTGSAPSYEHVVQYTANLRASGLFTGARIQRTEASQNVEVIVRGERVGEPSVTFQAKAVINSVLDVVVEDEAGEAAQGSSAPGTTAPSRTPERKP